MTPDERGGRGRGHTGRAFAYRFATPTGPPEARGAMPPSYRREIVGTLLVERDVAVPLRDGVVVYADVFRPADEQPAPPLVAWGPYGKHGDLPVTRLYPDGGVAPGQLSAYTGFESPDPVFWVEHGYAVVNVDAPGTWYSGGDATFISPEEADFGYDLVEWAGTQPWSTGRVGLSGVSYLTTSQWNIAATNPPHLAAINPWEGWSDTYREVVRHGGIPETSFWPYIARRWAYGTHLAEDLVTETAEHPLFDDFWASKAPPLEQIVVPAYVVASYSDQGLHTRGTLEGFTRIASADKWLCVHGGKKWGYYYSPEGQASQLAFFDHFLKDVDNDVPNWPTVRFDVRVDAHTSVRSTAAAWPLPGTELLVRHLDAATGSLLAQEPAAPATVDYDAEQLGRARSRATFDWRIEEATDLVGGARLHLWLSSADADDLDLFVALQKLDRYGDLVGFNYYAVFDDGPVALGWLRASHRELDRRRSTAHHPVLAHRREQKIPPGTVFPVDVEILPSGTRFEPTETLRVVVQGKDVHRYPRPLTHPVHAETLNVGLHRIHTGGEHDSTLVIPRLRD
ncbi:MAG: CocE/NonD family hydrolase [Acidimicrobiales bacterium]